MPTFNPFPFVCNYLCYYIKHGLLNLKRFLHLQKICIRRRKGFLTCVTPQPNLSHSLQTTGAALMYCLLLSAINLNHVTETLGCTIFNNVQAGWLLIPVSLYMQQKKALAQGFLLFLRNCCLYMLYGFPQWTSAFKFDILFHTGWSQRPVL